MAKKDADTTTAETPGIDAKAIILAKTQEIAAHPTLDAARKMYAISILQDVILALTPKDGE